MSESPEPRYEIEEWLLALRLSQYISIFQESGYQVVEDCRGLTDERLIEIQVLPTGHRKRILRSLEALGLQHEDGKTVKSEQEIQESVGDERKPRLYPRHVFLKDRGKTESCQHNQPKENMEYNMEAQDTIPDRQNVVPPVPAPRNLPLTQSSLYSSTCVSISKLSSSSSESLLNSEIPSDWEVPLGEQCHSNFATDNLLSVRPEDQFDFDGEMVENSIYETHPAEPRPTRSYRLRHRPVPEIPSETAMPPMERSAQTTSPEHLTGSERPTGANGIQKAPLQRTLTPIVPYGEVFLYNNPGSSPEKGAKDGLQKGFKAKMKQKKKRKKQKEKGSPPAPAVQGDDGYSTVNLHASTLPGAGLHPAFALIPETAPVISLTNGPEDESLVMVECDLYSDSVNSRETESPQPDISPYACFYGAPKQQVLKVGWLDKLSPQGNCVFQRRWVRFDGESLAYYNNEKEMYSKGLILVSAIRQIKGLGDNKFEVVTGLRTFTFRAEKEGERQEWMETLQTATRPPASGSQKRSDSLPHLSSTNKRGLLELRGYKGRVLVSLAGSKVRLCKTEQDFRAGLGICEVELTAANIKEVDRRGFEVNTPFKNFCFVADSEREKQEWVEAINESIAETLYDYEVAEKIWFNQANRSCADCGASQPEWASVNLGVVICKKCAGQHRSLGPSLSKVRSLKLDSSIWSNELVELFLEVGNMNANSFWAANLVLEEELHSGASAEQRASFVRRKYRERKYCKVLEDFNDLEELNQALCAAVVSSDVLQTMELVFSGADVMCATGDPIYSTPYLLAQRAGQKVQMEFLHQNKLSDFPRLGQWSEKSSFPDVSLFMDGFLYVSSGPSKTMPDRRGRDEMARRWCTLEGGFLSYYEKERSPSAIGRLDVTEVVSLAVSNSETMTGAGAVFTIELYLRTERALTVGAETQDTQHDWILALTKCIVPSKVEGLVRKDSELIGRLQYKEGHDLYHWRMGWFMLEGSTLHFSSGEEEADEEVLRLKQLQELTVSTQTEGEDRIQVLLLVESGRTLYIHGFNRMDFALWHSTITMAAGTDGRALGDQQLTKNGVPIIVDSCIAFVTQYGLCQKGVYQTPGDPARVSLLLEEFTRDARNVKLRKKEHKLEDVTDTLKSFLSHTEDALLTKELYPYWVSALDEKEEKQRVKKYSTFIESLPKVYRSTLNALLQHLYRIQQSSHLNEMPSEKLAAVFSCCLFQTQGQTSQEINVIRDLISNYVTLFSVNEEQVQQMETENSFIIRWNEKKETAFCPAGDLIFEVYLERREPEQCCLIKLSPSMRSSELAEAALSMRNCTFKAEDMWTTFEVIENGELERPLHHKENILEQVLEWSALDCPSSAFLVLKKFAGAKRMAGGKDSRQFLKSDYLKFSDGSTKLLSGHKFQDKYVVLHSEKLLLYRDIKNTKPEKEIQLKMAKCYLGLKKKLKPPTNWGFTVYTDKHQWHFCCDRRETQISWVADIIALKHGSDLQLKTSASKETADLKVSKGGSAVTERSMVPPYKHSFSSEMTDRRVSLGDTDWRTAKNPGVHLKTQSIPKYLKPGNPSETREVSQRRTSMDICLPQPLPPPSIPRHMKPMTLPVLPQASNKMPSKKPTGVGGSMPPNLLNELNLVLTKTGRKSPE